MADRNTRGHNRYRVYVSADGGTNWIPFSGAGAGGTSSSFGVAFPGAGTAIGFKDSTGANLAAGNLDASGNLKVSGTLSTTAAAAANAAHTNVALTGASQTILASNALRLAFSLYNDSANNVFIKFLAGASATSYAFQMLPQGQLTTKDVGVNFTGIIVGFSAVASGSFRVAEYTA